MKYCLQILIALSTAGLSFAQQSFHTEISELLNPDIKPFYFSVASGDPKPDGFVIWTKIIPDEPGAQQVNWQVASDTFMQEIVQTGLLMTDASSAYSVKVNINGLEQGTRYFYRFQHEGIYSPIGRTKTAPTGDPSKVTFAVVSCADYTMGYFNAFGDIAKRTDIDAVLHLGDYIYEYGNRKGGRGRLMKSTYRKHIPDNELLSLQDYRTRYAQYRLDPQLMEAHRLHPFIVVWDDHESANDSYATGAQNHQQGEGDWKERAATARQVYFEWLPVRDNPSHSIIRSFTFGNLAGLWMLDSRLEERSPQASGKNDPSLSASDRHMLGNSQTDWLLNGIGASKARWKVIGNQVIFSPLNDSKVFDRTPSRAMDRWDGYPAERNRIMDFFNQNDINNIVVVTGDVHTSWAFELTQNPADRELYDPKTGKGVIGAEFITPSISAFNFNEVVPGFLSWEAKRRFLKKKNNPHLRFLDLNHHGYMTLTLTPERARADWYFVKHLDRVNDKVKMKTYRYLQNAGVSLERK